MTLPTARELTKSPPFPATASAGKSCRKEFASRRPRRAASDFRSPGKSSTGVASVYLKTGRMMPEDGLEQLRPFDAIFLGAVGHPSVADHVSLWGLLIPIRRGFQQYANIRPVRLLPGIEPAVRNFAPGQIDFCVVRENNEGEYSNIGGRLYRGHRGGVRGAAVRLHAARMRPHHPLRLRAGENAPAPRHFGDQIKRHHLHHAFLGRALRRHGQRVSGNSHRPVSHRYPERAFRAASGLV